MKWPELCILPLQRGLQFSWCSCRCEFKANALLGLWFLPLPPWPGAPRSVQGSGGARTLHRVCPRPPFPLCSFPGEENLESRIASRDCRDGSFIQPESSHQALSHARHCSRVVRVTQSQRCGHLGPDTFLLQEGQPVHCRSFSMSLASTY